RNRVRRAARVAPSPRHKSAKADRGGRAGFLIAALLDEVYHMLDRRNSGYRLFFERESVSYGAQKLSVDINGASAHTGENACTVDKRPAQPGYNNTLLGIGQSLDYSKDFDVKFFGLRSLKYG